MNTSSIYITRVFDTIKYIDRHLDDDLNLDFIAKKAFYSPYHFHRLFKAVTGESLNVFITRKRMERAASLLIKERQMTVKVISYTCGFKDNSVFTKTFKKYFQLSPSQFRLKHSSRYSKLYLQDSKNGQIENELESYLCNIEVLKNWIMENGHIEVMDLPQLRFASINHLGIKGIENTFTKLIAWAEPKGLLDNPESKMARIFYDSFKNTAPDKVRMSICLLTEDEFEADDLVSEHFIDEGRYIAAHFEIPPVDFEKAWSASFIWMNENGHKMASKNPFEIYYNDFNSHPEGKAIVDLFIPIQ
jgi:AraC family transcriptional regulator